MRAMILAAGRGMRMRPLTDHTPKPLLCVGGKPLIVWHIERLAAAGIHDIIINHAWLGAQIETQLGCGSRYGVRLHYSPEPTALETAGGIAHALPLLGADPFLVINGDIWCDWSVHTAYDACQQLRAHDLLAWLWLVNNPEHHPAGDFALTAQARVHDGANPSPTTKPALFTFAGIGVYAPALFRPIPKGAAYKLAPLLRHAMQQNRVGGHYYAGKWVDIGTPARLQRLDTILAKMHRSTFSPRVPS